MSEYIGTPLGTVLLELYNTQILGQRSLGRDTEDSRRYMDVILLQLEAQGLVLKRNKEIKKDMVAEELLHVLNKHPYVLTDKGKAVASVLKKAVDDIDSTMKQ